MEQNYVIAWRSDLTGYAGQGDQTFPDLDSVNAACKQLNEGCPDYQFWPVALSDDTSNEQTQPITVRMDAGE